MESIAEDNVHQTNNLFLDGTDKELRQSYLTYTLVLNQKLDLHLTERLQSISDHLICADGAANHIKNYNNSVSEPWIPHLLIGDFDSVNLDVISEFETKGAKVVKDPDQNTTDLQKAIYYLYNNRDESHKSEKKKVLIVLGAFGGRMDHTIYALHLLYKFHSEIPELFREFQVYFMDKYSMIKLLLPGINHIIPSENFESKNGVGVIPLKEKSKIQSKGLLYEMGKIYYYPNFASGEDYEVSELNFGERISTSNSLNAKKIIIKTSSPVLWITSLNKL